MGAMFFCGTGSSQILILFLDLEALKEDKSEVTELPSWRISADLVPPLLEELFPEWQLSPN